jgi:hypothetical protein
LQKYISSDYSLKNIEILNCYNWCYVCINVKNGYFSNIEICYLPLWYTESFNVTIFDLIIIVFKMND